MGDFLSHNDVFQPRMDTDSVSKPAAKPDRAAVPKCRVMPQSLEWTGLLGYFNETKD